MPKLNVIGIAALAVGGVGLLFAILACALPLWVIQDLPGCDGCSKSGIWEFCFKLTTGGDETCTDIEKDTVSTEQFDEAKVMRAMTLLGIILAVPAIAVGVLVMFVLKQMKILYFVAGGIEIVAGLFTMVAFAYHADNVYDKDNDAQKLGASFALDVVAWILAWVAGALFIVAKIMDKE